MKMFSKKEKSKELEKEQQESRLANEMYNKFQDARMAKQSFVDMWDKCISAYSSEYFNKSNMPDFKSNQISNYIFATIETIKPIMLDGNPRFEALPATQESIEPAEKMQSVFDYEWKRAKMFTKLLNAITLTLQIGNAVWLIPWNGKEQNGLGNTTPILINPYNIFPDPMATSFDNAEYVIYATYKHINVLKSKFPNKSNSLESGTIKYPELVSLGGLQDTGSVDNQVLVLECYVKDYTTIDVEETVNGSTETKKKRKYPNCRIITVAPELNLILEDKISPYKDEKNYPFVLQKNYDIPLQFWGVGDVEQLISPQQYIIDLTNQIIDNAKLTANMPWVVDKNSGIGKGELSNRPGLVIRKNPGSYIERMQPPQMPMYVRETIEILKKDMEVISGIHEVTQGRKPGSVTAGNAIQALLEAGQARIRLKVKIMETALEEILNMWYNRNKQFWLTTRQIRKEEKDSNGNVQFVEVNPEDYEAEIDLLLVTGSTMPVNKSSMLEMMTRLAQTPGEDGMPMVDRQTVLAYTNVPDKTKIIKKFEEISGMKKQEEAMMQEQLTSQQDADMQRQMQMQQQQMAMELAKEQEKANIESIRTTNSEITDEQLQMVIEELKKNPELLQQLTAQPQEEQIPDLEDLEL
jgi:hypothetical protein